MGLFNRAKDEAQNLAQQHPDQASEAMDKAGQEADQATGGKFDSQIQSGMQAAQQQIGVQPSGQGQDPSQYQDQGQQDQGQQDQGQGQDQGQDPNAWGDNQNQ
jgi:hypothetical protein